MQKKGMIIGRIGKVTGDTVAGRALNKGEEKPVEVKLLVNGNIVMTTLANKFRKGAKDEGIHPTGYCGYNFELNENQRLKRGDTIRVVAGEDSIELHGSPVKFTGIQEYKYKSQMPEFNKKLFYMHIAKAAGTSLNAYIESHYPSKRVWTHLEGNKNWESKTFSDNYDFLSGHLRIQVISRLINLENFSKITLLRDPLQHVISHISWVRFIGKDENSRFFLNHSESIRNLSKKMKAIDFTDHKQLESFIDGFDDEARNLFDNCQTRYFLQGPIKENITRKHSQLAVDAFGYFDLIGISEEYDQFVNILKTKMNWSDKLIESQRLNVQENKSGLNASDPKIREALSRLTFADQIVYDKAKELFKEVLSDISKGQSSGVNIKQRQDSDRHVFFFIHIPKTAGTSFRNMLYTQFPQEKVYPNSNEITLPAKPYRDYNHLQSLSIEKTGNIELLSGHYPYACGDLLPAKPIRMVFLRAPVDRVVSYLRHLQRHAKEFKGQSLIEIYEQEKQRSFQVSNYQVRFFADSKFTKPLMHFSSAIDNSALEVAKENIAKCDFIGITEHFPESVQLAQALFGWNLGKALVQNVDDSRNNSQITDELLKRIYEDNKLDIEFYKYAETLFSKMSKKHGIKSESLGNGTNENYNNEGNDPNNNN